MVSPKLLLLLIQHGVGITNGICLWYHLDNENYMGAIFTSILIVWIASWDRKDPPTP